MGAYIRVEIARKLPSFERDITVNKRWALIIFTSVEATKLRVQGPIAFAIAHEVGGIPLEIAVWPSGHRRGSRGAQARRWWGWQMIRIVAVDVGVGTSVEL